MRRSLSSYQRINDDIPLINPAPVPEFSPYTSGRNLASFQQAHGGGIGGGKDNIIELFSQVPEPDKIQTIQEDDKIAPYKENSDFIQSEEKGEKRPIMNLLFTICLVLFLVICGNFFTKTIESISNNSPYIQYLMIAFIFFLLAGLFAWGLNL